MRLILLLAEKMTAEDLPAVVRLMWGSSGAAAGSGGAVRPDLFDFER
jgi:hypothetical protein